MLRSGTQSLPRNLAEQVAGELGMRIVRGDLSPGNFLADEQGLGAEFGVSKTVVREAIKLLTAKGLVQVRPRHGTKILPRSMWRVLDPELLFWHQKAQPSKAFLLQLYELRQVVEPAAAKLATVRATDEELLEIRASYEAMVAHQADVNAFVEADARFHKLILRAAHNEFMSELENIIFAALLMSIRITNPSPEQNRLSLPFHEAVIKRLEARDGEGVTEAMERLFSDVAKRLEQIET